MNVWVILFWTVIAAEIYTHIVYPLLMALCGRERPASGDATELPAVSLVIPAYNEEAVIRAKLENTLSIDYPSELLEVLVASDGSTDETITIAGEFESHRVKVLEYEQRRGKASVVNDAINLAASDVVCLCDANVMFRPDALKKMISRLNDHNVGVVTGIVQIASDESDFGAGESLYARLDRAVQRGESRVGSVMGVDGGMYVIRRTLFQPLEPDTILDDFTIAMRIVRSGNRVDIEPEAVATENGTPTARQEFRRRARIAAGSVQCLRRGIFPRLNQPVLFWQFLSHKLLRWLGPVFLGLLLLSSAFLWNVGTLYQTASLLQIAFYAIALAAALIPKLRRSRAVSVIFYFAMSHAAMLVGSIKGIFNRQSAAWSRTDRAPMNRVAL